MDSRADDPVEHRERRTVLAEWAEFVSCVSRAHWTTPGRVHPRRYLSKYLTTTPYHRVFAVVLY